MAAIAEHETPKNVQSPELIEERAAERAASTSCCSVSDSDVGLLPD